MFLPGDKIICIDDHPHPLREFNLLKNKMYVVTEIDIYNQCKVLQDPENKWWAMDRFVKCKKEYINQPDSLKDKYL